jgi:hypothetical protein
MDRRFSILLAACAVVLSVFAAGPASETAPAQFRADEMAAPLTWAWD